jgi:acetyl-CoA C-acetyltransferase
MNEAVIVSAVRTPLGSFNGSLAGIGATDLGAIVIEEAVKRAGIEKSEVNEVLMGRYCPAAMARTRPSRRRSRPACPGKRNALPSTRCAVPP